MFCQNTDPSSGLNFYSKNSLVREKRNITSLYSLIATSPTHVTVVDNFSFKIAVPKDNVLRHNQSSKQLNATSSLKYFHLSGLHEYEQIDILKEAHMDTLSRNHSAKSIASRCSLSHVERWKRRAMRNSYREECEDNRDQEMRQNKSESQELAESIFRDEEIYEEMPAESVVIDKIGLSSVQKITNPQFFSHQPTPSSPAQPPSQQQPSSTLQGTVLVFPQPLQPEPSSSTFTSNPIYSVVIQTPDIQIPDKISTIQADVEYDQKDFFDLVDSPIELIKADTNRHQSSEFGIDKGMKEELKEMLGYNKRDQIMPAQVQQKKLATENQEKEKGRGTAEQLQPPKPKKMNFKAMMSKHKKPESEEEKQEKKKRLLLNFFDQN